MYTLITLLAGFRVGDEVLARASCVLVGRQGKWCWRQTSGPRPAGW